MGDEDQRALGELFAEDFYNRLPDDIEISRFVPHFNAGSLS
jgi:hypothetical protein